MLHMLFIFAVLHMLFKHAVDHFLASSMGLSIGWPYLCIGVEFLALLSVGCAQKSEEARSGL
jgi:hypothetical protein